MGLNALALDPAVSESWMLSDGSQLATPTIPVATYREHQLDYVDEFDRLVSQWRLETALSSSVQDKIESSFFKKIVDMKEKIIPLIINELQNRPDFLFLALELIVKDNVIPKEAKGKVDLRIDAWLNWAKENNINAD